MFPQNVHGISAYPVSKRGELARTILGPKDDLALAMDCGRVGDRPQPVAVYFDD